MGKLTYFILTSIVVLCAYEIRRITQLEYIYPEIGYSIEELVESLGYKCENHTVITKDGYILEFHRITSQKLKFGRPPIFIMHGLAGKSLSWLITLNKSLPIYLANQGFDVWLGNARGNTYSRKHVAIDPDTNPEKFFDFSWHEIGSIDVPTMIDYVLENTGFEKLYYVGHSQGTVVFYVMMSEKPEYNKKVELMVGLAPVVYTKGIGNAIYKVSPKAQRFIEWFLPIIGIHQMLPHYSFWKVLGNAYCRDGSLFQTICFYPFGRMGGFNPRGLNSTMMPLLITHFGAGASIKQSHHYTQVAHANTLQRYDHGTEENIRRYGQTNPPLYYLNRTTVPVALLWSKNDFFITETNIKRLHQELPNVILNHQIADERFSHMDFVLSFTAEKHLHPLIKKVLDQYESKKNVTL